jgi:hypothetical protein
LNRLLAGLFVCVIGVDIAADGRCDPVPTASGAVAFTAAADRGDTDPCARQCVADCFCCSRSLAVGRAFVAPARGPVEPTPELGPLAVPAGVRPVLYRPPLLLA